ncbi:GlxA family transcriptional regulator [Roseinatronobacter alkalisoli]|uniref:Helix-turn-helix domain-containing protein n=1 Tax=Roseinatronobacter alkalisoli TaxID=3028235 RepID=A0ABT5TFA8_9RHOB|nr:helix-turn-helix domain-containing protein [Roseinatronobacter sp. HJB301]MDD7973812.1 helix-turn-helix domain-containing protein [Roseinatronobacter sp. HJB301]
MSANIETPNEPLSISILAFPGMSVGTPVSGLFETLAIGNAVLNGGRPGETAHFHVEIVGPEPGIFPGACGLPLQVHRGVAEVERTDIVIAPSMFLPEEGWVKGRQPEVIAWLRRQHEAGADLCTACAGALVLAETGLLDGRETTTHWAFADTFRRNFPQVRLRLEELLVVNGTRGEFVMSGAANSWQDLILFLIARHVSPRAAQSVGKFLLYQWNMPSQAPFMPFSPGTDHGDGAIRAVQEYLDANTRLDLSVDELADRTGLARATFNRRFARATGHAPIDYLQRLRVEKAKAMLEETGEPIEEIGWQVGYDEPAAFRRIFRKVTRLTPSDYRRKFRVIKADRTSGTGLPND